MKEKLRRFHVQLNNNRGVGIVTVVIAVAFLVVLGTVILFTSYNGVKTSVSAREGEEYFYDADAALNQIKAGLEEEEAQAFYNAYMTVLENYIDLGESAASEFDTLFMEQFNDSSVIDLTAMTYSFDALAAYITDEVDGVSIEVGNSDPDAEFGTLIRKDAENETEHTTLTLKDVRVTCTSGTRKSTVSADLEMILPRFSYSDSQYSASGASSYGVIADKALVLNGLKSAAVKGDAFAGSVSVTANKTLTVSDGTFVCADEIRVTNDGSFNSATDSVLWTRGIDVGLRTQKASRPAGVTLQGTSYVADDLNLSGTNANAVLSGNYFGFGSSTTDSSKSSAIFANANDTEVDFSDLDNLMLAGYSFVSTMNDELKKIYEQAGIPLSDVRMGESLSAKPNQQIYLVPAESVRYFDNNTLASVPSNPTVTGDSAEVKKMLNATIRTTDQFLTGASVKTVAVPAGSQWIVYFFMEFNDPQDASIFFRNYMFGDGTENDDERIDVDERRKKAESYLDSYITVAQQAKDLQTKGYTFTNSTGNDLALKAYLKNSDSVDQTSKQLSTVFENLCKTLTSYKVGDYNSPYEYVVATDKVNELPSGAKYFYENGTSPVAVVVNGDYTYSADEPSTLRLIIASGDVTVNTNYTGMIYCGDTLVLNADVTADTESVYTTSLAVNGSEHIAEYMKLINSENSEQSESSSNAVICVTVKNWHKG